VQRDTGVDGAVSVAPVAADGESDVLRVRARKLDGAEGFLLVFGFEGQDSYYWWNVGGWGNTEHALQRRAGGRSQDRMIAARGAVETGKWHDLRVELTPGRIRCYLDDQLVHDYRPTRPEVRVSPTLDESTGEVLVKLVNPAEEPIAATLKLSGASSLASVAHVTTLTGEPGGVNSIEREPIRPVESVLPASDTIEMELPACSVQVVKVKVK
ncbi:MAG: hypothetical protein KDA37_12860, partial [Planctomycetales bacterium]|nr:hypothetical protein [Planctomycetales bacterium]